MNILNCVLDSLVDDSEAITQILEYLSNMSINISRSELQEVLDKMVFDGLIENTEIWTNENNENPYSITDKGKKIWQNLEQETF